MESQDSKGASFRDAVEQLQAQEWKRYEEELANSEPMCRAKDLYSADSNIEGQAKYDKQRLDLLDENYDLKEKLAKSTESSYDSRRLRDERDALAREKVVLERQLDLIRRQAIEFKEAARRYKAQAEKAKERYSRAKETVSTWQGYVDRHSPAKRERQGSRGVGQSTVSSGSRLTAVVPPADVHAIHEGRDRRLAPEESHERPWTGEAWDLLGMTYPGLQEHGGKSISRASKDSGLPSELPLPVQGGSSSQQSYVTAKQQALNTGSAQSQHPEHRSSEPVELAHMQHQDSPHQVRTETLPKASDGQIDTNTKSEPINPAILRSATDGPTSDNKSGFPSHEDEREDPAIPSSQSTDEEITLQTNTAQQNHAKPTKPDPDLSSSPIVVSERRIKRKHRGTTQNEPRLQNVDAIMLSDGSATKSFTIKEEHSSIPPGLPRVATLLQVSSLDLDEVSDRVDTPRKRQRLQRLHYSRRLNDLSERMASNLGHDRATSVPLAIEQSETLEANQGSSQSVSRSFDEHDIGLLEAAEGIESHAVGSVGDATKPPLPSDSPLQPISLNRQNIRPPKGRHYSGGRFGPRDKALVLLTEDGESLSVKQSPSRATNELKTNHTTETPNAHRASGQRVQTLLQKPPSQDQTALVTPQGPGKLKRPSTTGRIACLVDEPASEPAAAPLVTPQNQPVRNRPQFPATEPQRARRNTKSPTKDSDRRLRPAKGHASNNRPANARPASPSPSHEPLAARPLNRLGLQDFKINPAFNNGLKYAYDDTVRRIAEKACLPGCTDPRCCGDQFRRIAELGLTPGARSAQDPHIQQYAGEDEADLKILENHRGGGDFARKQINDMDPAQRANAIVEAKAAEIAQKFGKHRQRNERRRTPDGFWDAEMPSTQKLEGHKEAVAKTERETVEARYREAKREDRKGRWLFRDE